SEAWQELDPVICYLNEQHRQDDDEFLEILNALRGGDIRRRHAEALLDRIGKDPVGAQTDVTELHTVNVDVDRINSGRLDGIDSDGYKYTMVTTGSEGYVEALKRSCLAQEELVLKQGAFVMCIKNSPDKKYVNGSLGIVTGFEDATNLPIVELQNGRKITMGMDTWELRDGTKKRASISQIPLRLAWAITVHKSQGMTLDAAKIDLRRAFVEGMGYVALSRVRRLDALSLVGINQMALKVSQDALEIDKGLRAKALTDYERFKKLEKQAAKRQKEDAKKPKKTAASSDWHEKIAKMRETYPNAFRPWKAEDDVKLKALFDEGTKVTKLSEAFGRHPGSIKARLKKHYGEDVALQ
ncbi:MAG TPA: hypothetical protein VH144_02275, partial [Candidatus Saccharimonadales bacterium]|nr:hypothetical protein [Candidatus Saccharimonadales bacterium]